MSNKVFREDLQVENGKNEQHHVQISLGTKCNQI